ncbi:EamA family transporter [Kineococcus sp. TRM81007]|uniref:EamA family transporter n=1 Tax=Kineococcus sp. TRM81007 TaxID=2925831 RepID=UPI001F56E817|nr:EamA family transporter [Kineococcus sp. TRM81007]MCI2240345.1 EamA family transporter [Kineococcus sp. TRM81007]
MSAALALLASALWGTSDFLGGTVSRRLRAVQVLAVSQVLSCAVLLAVLGGSLGAGAGAPVASWLGWSLLAGVTWAGAMAALYTALARGTMGVVAPIAAGGAVLPVLLGLAAGERPAPVQLAGVAIAIAGVVASAGPDLRGGAGRQGAAVALALLAAVLFGVEIWALARGSASSVPATLLGMRVTSAALVVAAALARRGAQGPGRVQPRDLPLLLALGVLDLAATAAYALASRSALVSVVAVLASLYPAVTVLLARQVHGERLSRVQAAGVVVVLVGAVCAGLG